MTVAVEQMVCVLYSPSWLYLLVRGMLWYLAERTCHIDLLRVRHM